MFVIDVLISAPAASAEIGTFRLHAMRRWLPDFDKLGFGELLFLAHDFGRNEFALDGKRNEDRFALFARDALSTKGDVFDS